MTNDPPRYVNPRSGASWPVDIPIWRAPDDDGYVNLSAGDGLRRDDIDTSLGSLWRYRKRSGYRVRHLIPLVKAGRPWSRRNGAIARSK